MSRMNIVLKHYRRRQRSDSTLAGAATGFDYDPINENSAAKLKAELRALDFSRPQSRFFPTFAAIFVAIFGIAR